jgi:molecular chaperone HscB
MYQCQGQLALDVASIEATYYRLMKVLHPDRYAQKSDDQHQLSIRYSELVNNGFATLKNSFKRANYFADLHTLKEKSDSIPPEVMADVFEIHELLEQPTLSASQIAELETFSTHFTEKQTALKGELDQLFKRHDEQHLSPSDIKNDLNKILNKAAYFNRLVDRMMEKLDTE